MRRRSVRGERNGYPYPQYDTQHNTSRRVEEDGTAGGQGKEGHIEREIRLLRSQEQPAADKKGDKYIRFKLNFLLTEANNSDRAKEGNPISDRRTDVRKHVHRHRISISGHLLYHPPLATLLLHSDVVFTRVGWSRRRRPGESERSCRWLFR